MPRMDDEPFRTTYAYITRVPCRDVAEAGLAFMTRCSLTHRAKEGLPVSRMYGGSGGVLVQQWIIEIGGSQQRNICGNHDSAAPEVVAEEEQCQSHSVSQKPNRSYGSPLRVNLHCVTRFIPCESNGHFMTLSFITKMVCSTWGVVAWAIPRSSPFLHPKRE